MAMLRSLLLLFIMFSMGNAGRKCPYGWTNFGVRCYKVFSQSVTWATAEKNCQSHGANLASVHSKVENDFLLSLSASTRPYVGAHDGEQEGQWFWTDGSVYDYTNWCAGEPSGGVSENCVVINYIGTSCWVDISCTAMMGFVCATDL